MTERKGIVTFKGIPLPLIGPDLNIGDAALLAVNAIQ